MKGILLSGKSGAGKDAIAKELIEEYGFKRYAFADELKSFCSKTYGYDNELNYTQEGKDQVITIKKTEPDMNGQLQEVVWYQNTIRNLLIEIGKQQRINDPLYWVTIIKEKIKEEKPERVIITDCRYENEAEAFREDGFMIVRIDANEKTRMKRGVSMEQAFSEDESECELDDYSFDLRIENNIENDEEKNLRGKSCYLYEQFEVFYETTNNNNERTTRTT